MAEKPTYEELEQRVKELEQAESERKRAEEALRKSEALLQAAMNQSQAGIAIAGAPDGKLRYVNDTGLVIRGESRKKIVNGIGIDKYVASWQILHFDGTPYKDDEVPLARAIMYGEVCSEEFIVRRKDKEDRIVLANAAPVFDDKGSLFAGIVVFLDITERVIAQEALRKAHDELEMRVEERTVELSKANEELSVEIAERKRAEEALRESEGNLQRHAHDLGERVKELNCLYGISNLVDKLGTSLDEIIQSVVDHIPSAWQYPEITSARILLEDKEYKTENFKETNWKQSSDIVATNKRMGVLEICYLEEKPEIDEGPFLKEERNLIGAITGRLGRIIERKRAERALRESERKRQSWIENSPVCTKIVDLDFNLQFMSASGIRDLKIDNINEFYGKPYPFHFYPDSFKIPMTNNLKKAKETGAIITQEASVLDIEGNKLWYHSTIVPVNDDEGKVNYMLVVSLDATERKQAEEALRESEEKYRSMMEAMDDEAYICSSDFRIEYMNPAMINRIGRDATGETCYGVVSGFNKKCPWCVHEKVMKGEYVKYELVSPINAKTYHISNSPIFHTDKSVSKLTVSRDFTEMKKLEAQLQQALKMEAMGTLAGGIAHDFNNVLMTIQGRTSIMLMEKDSSHPDIRHLKGIEDNIESAADLTRQLLGFARGGKYEVKPTDLNELVKKENRMFGQTKKQISIHGKYEKDLWSVEVDQGQIAQVLLNLYVNAWQAMPAGGDLYLGTENVTLDENYVKPFSIEPGKYVKISVTDTGTGMDKATRERIFEPFFTTKEMGRGTGLGLASAYGIIKNHSGFINVYSEKGHGTTFNIYLPASEKEAIEEKKAAVDTLRGTETVLFVDDEEMIIEVASEVLENLGYNVLTARSGKEACEIYEKNKEQIDIVLLDMIMPDMSGSDTYDRMKELDPDIKVLLSSGYSINGQATEIMDRGCNGFIQKPFKMKELSQKLREILDKK